LSRIENLCYFFSLLLHGPHALSLDAGYTQYPADRDAQLRLIGEARIPLRDAFSVLIEKAERREKEKDAVILIAEKQTPEPLFRA
jgi:hypothetical protein